ncbi:hypothetical protein INT80_09130 [Gallibacterium anatis]|uniref:Uncharacterized protein n=1 Tax=Gallibacterium anatis TaxID=750 RepID=A0A930Y8S0_9PAST|nr:hypothetical protein [Gallibacterium anatis]
MITDKDGNIIPADELADKGISINQGTGEVTFKPDAIADGSTISVHNENGDAQNPSKTVTETAPKDDHDADGSTDDVDQDDDNDGLADDVENKDPAHKPENGGKGLDPHNPDTNGDGVNDGDEDSDGDGVKNKDDNTPFLKTTQVKSCQTKMATVFVMILIPISMVMVSIMLMKKKQAQIRKIQIQMAHRMAIKTLIMMV